MRRLLVFGLLVLTAASTAAQQPGKGSDKKAPALPAVNPAVAKLAFTIADLAGPAFDLAAGGANDNELVAVACEHDVLEVFRKNALRDPKEAQVAKPALWRGHQGPVVAVAYHGGPVLVSAGADKKIVFWKAPEGKPLQTVLAGTRLRCLALSPDGTRLASAGEDGIVQLWDVAGAKPGAKLVGHKDWVLCLAFSPDGKQLVSGSIDGSLRLWDVAGAKKLAELPFRAPSKTPPEPIAVHSAAFAPDGKAIYYGGADGPIRVINPGDGKTIRTLTGHTGVVTALRFHPSGNLLASASKDRTILLWNPAQPKPLKKLEGHTAWVEGLAFINQGQRLASAGADKTLRIWDLTDAKKKK